jgi:hypothetical protein
MKYRPESSVSMAPFGHSGRQTPQPMQASVMDIAMGYSRLRRFCSSALATAGVTKRLTSPPMSAISRTNVPLTNWKDSPGIMKTVSASGMSERFMPAI